MGHNYLGIFSRFKTYTSVGTCVPVAIRIPRKNEWDDWVLNDINANWVYIMTTNAINVAFECQQLQN